MLDGNTIAPICSAVEGHLQTTIFPLEHIDINKHGNKRNQGVLLRVAATRGYEALVRQLLERGCHPDAGQMVLGSFRWPSRNTELRFAVKSGHEKIVKLLLEHGANQDYGAARRTRC